jgi:hypothetical protein
MAETMRFLMAPEDELAFVRFLARFRLEVYPVRVPPGWKTFLASDLTLPEFPADALYLAAADLGEILVDKLKRGPDKGSWRVDEVRSPVIYFERSRLDEEGALLSGKLWAELDVTPQTGRRAAAPERFRQLFLQIQDWLKRNHRRSEPKGFWIGPGAARRFKQGLRLRDADPKGSSIEPYR